MRTIVSFSFLFILGNIFAQDNLESLLGSVNSDSLVINTFKSTRIVNNHSVELFSPKKLDFTAGIIAAPRKGSTPAYVKH